MPWFESGEAKQKRLSQAQEKMIRAIELDDPVVALEQSRSGIGLGEIRGAGWSSIMPAQPALLLAVRWGSSRVVEALLAEGVRLGLTAPLQDPRLMLTALLAGQTRMARALRQAGAPAPSVEQLEAVLEKARNSDGRKVRNQSGANEIRRRECDRGPSGLLWRDLLDPVLEWALSEMDPARLGGQAGADFLGKAGSGRRARALLAAGANPNQPDFAGVWPLDRAIQAGKRDWIEALIEGGAEPASLGRSGDMMSAAARCRRPEAAEWGLQALRDGVASAMGEPSAEPEAKPPSRRL